MISTSEIETRSKTQVASPDKIAMLKKISATGESMVDLSSELANVVENIEKYKNNFIAADKIMYILGCDDGRVGAPPTLQTIDGKQVLMVYVPRIGGGVPNKDLMQYLHDETTKLRGSVENVELIVTQHGSTTEVTQACDHNEISECTCGLRAVFSGAEAQLKSLGDMLRTEQVTNRKKFEDLSEDSKNLIMFLSTHTKIPQRLIRIAAEANFASDITKNALAVTDAVSSFDIFDKEAIKAGYFNHNSKFITVIDNEGSSTEEKFEVSDDKWEGKEHQNPSGLVISFGPQASFVPDGIILPESVGNGINNDFTAVAAGVDKNLAAEDLMNALSEVWYAANNYKDAQEGHAHGKNFTDIEYCAILCDNADYVALATTILASSEFKTDFAPAYAFIGEIKLVNIQDGTVTPIEVSTSGAGGGGTVLHPSMIEPEPGQV